MNKRIDTSCGDGISPLATFLSDLHGNIGGAEITGKVADYIPELAKADPNWFGISIATTDGYEYGRGDTEVPFTIQSISKAFTYGLALQEWGEEQVTQVVGVEPSGDAFNSISLDPVTGRPFNPMINAGAIAASGLIFRKFGDAAFDRILEVYSAFAGRPLELDKSVYASERDTGHRNRAIGHLLRNFGILNDAVEPALELYFKQCAIAVTCRDLSIMAATLANHGVNPLTGNRAISREQVQRVLSVMSTCGMYDYSGEWVYRVGLPAKSGVGGGILCVLPGQFGIGVFSPPLDAQGNSSRGLEVCERVAKAFGLHLLQVPCGAGSVIRRRFTLKGVRSRYQRTQTQSEILEEHGHRVVVFELQGDLSFSSTERLLRELAGRELVGKTIILSFDRCISIESASIRFIADYCRRFRDAGGRCHFVGFQHLENFERRIRECLNFQLQDHSVFSGTLNGMLELCEERLIAEVTPGGAQTSVPLAEQQLMAEMTDIELAVLADTLEKKVFEPGDLIFSEGETSTSLYLIESGEVSVVLSKMGADIQVARICAGRAFGEMGLIDGLPRSAGVRAVTEVACWCLHYPSLEDVSRAHRGDVKFKLMRNIAATVSERLRVANDEIISFR